AGLDFVAEAAKTWSVDGPTLVDAFDATWFEGLLQEAFSTRPPLATFDRSGHELAIENFRKLDMQNLSMRRQVLAAAHWERLPDHQDVGEMRILNQEISKKRRHLPIRQLMVKVGRCIQAIKP